MLSGRGAGVLLARAVVLPASCLACTVLCRLGIPPARRSVVLLSRRIALRRTAVLRYTVALRGTVGCSVTVGIGCSRTRTAYDSRILARRRRTGVRVRRRLIIRMG